MRRYASSFGVKTHEDATFLAVKSVCVCAFVFWIIKFWGLDASLGSIKAHDSSSSIQACHLRDLPWTIVWTSMNITPQHGFVEVYSRFASYKRAVARVKQSTRPMDPLKGNPIWGCSSSYNWIHNHNNRGYISQHIPINEVSCNYTSNNAITLVKSIIAS